MCRGQRPSEALPILLVLVTAARRVPAHRHARPPDGLAALDHRRRRRRWLATVIATYLAFQRCRARTASGITFTLYTWIPAGQLEVAATAST